ncbi:MAG: dUTP pyrophosphatase [Epulopiscium sp. Nele67-Bin004]|nr:MAG: dUTP pyrophosphatase [Epulopiscium sp. Nele67-Bin004]
MDKSVIYFAKTHQDGIIPSKREEDGAFDIYARFDDDYIIIKPHQTVMVPTGIASAFSSDYVAILKERGSNGSLGIGQRAGVIDSGYRGEWFVGLTNHNDTALIIAKEGVVLPTNIENPIIYPYTKAVAQCIVTVVPKVVPTEIDYDTLKTFESERKDGKLGSSQK